MGKQPLVLMILDGWGIREACADNAISSAQPDNFYNLQQSYPHVALQCSGQEVGLPAGLMGNSEVGHLNIGAGRIVWQEISRITNAVEVGTFFNNPVLLQAADFARQHGGAVHLMGLLSDGGVHSDMGHIFALLRFCKEQKLSKVFIHAYLDGRDVGPKSALSYIECLQNYMDDLALGEFATVGGRYYAMDRDKHWDRVELAWRAMVLGEGTPATSARAAVAMAYDAHLSDEFILPAIIVDETGYPHGLVRDGDSVIFFNFRTDRAREISHAFTDQEFEHFERQRLPQVYFACMTDYDITLQAEVVFPQQNLEQTLGEVIAQAGLKQLRMAETEKYAHVTFFLNGGVEEPNPGEERILIPSPAVATYDLQPEMSAPELTARLLQEIQRDYYDVIIVNYANPDMVGHTGVLDAAVQAVKTVDVCLKQVVDAILERQGVIIITSDHGNCEQMKDEKTGEAFTAHTCNPIDFMVIGVGPDIQGLRDNGSLQDIAPTMLEILNITQPEQMTGQSLIIRKQ